MRRGRRKCIGARSQRGDGCLAVEGKLESGSDVLGKPANQSLCVHSASFKPDEKSSLLNIFFRWGRVPIFSAGKCKSM